jgi:hypothetical protein
MLPAIIANVLGRMAVGGAATAAGAGAAATSVATGPIVGRVATSLAGSGQAGAGAPRP